MAIVGFAAWPTRESSSVFFAIRCNMTRFLLAATIFCFSLAPVAGSAEVPKKAAPQNPMPSKAAPVYVKIIWPVDPAVRAKLKDPPVIESWITKSIENPLKAKLVAVTEWVPLVEERFENGQLWDGILDGVHHACIVSADEFERKDGKIKIVFRGWGPGGGDVNVSLNDESGSREVVPVTVAKTKFGMPHVAVFVGPPVK